MSKTIIQVEGIGKCYRLGESGGTDSFREAISNTMNRFGRRMVGRGEPKKHKRDFWALKDVSFDIKQGEVLGIVGHNGAGKSTLLKILSRITDPSEGTAKIWGRVGSLLEVGTGFHPELTGRENIFLNGAILGMTTGEIKSKFDEIVDFAEIEEFLETPVKRYSSGMYVRLAFAVAAHLEPEVLIVDEVLAVGDAKFQARCMNKMQDVASHGRTILFVSHNMGAVQSLCSRGVVLSHGEVIAEGSAKDAVAAYLAVLDEKSHIDLADRTDRSGMGKIRMTSVAVKCAEGKDNPYVEYGAPARIEVTIDNPRPEIICVLRVFNHLGGPTMEFRSRPVIDLDTIDKSGAPRIICEIPELPLAPGEYRLDAQIWAAGDLQDAIESAAKFTVSAGQMEGRLLDRAFGKSGVVPRHYWTLPG